MAGERDLSKLLAGLEPSLNDEIYVFATVSPDTDISHLFPLMQFTEEEGVTLILKKAEAEAAEISHELPCRQITLKIHSALDAAGMMAAIAAALAEENIPVNPVAGFYHDHLFVPEDRAEEVMSALKNLKIDP